MTTWQWSVIQALIRMVLSMSVYGQNTPSYKNEDCRLLKEALKRGE